MKLPSIRQLFEHSSKTFSRFPFALTSAVIGTGAWIILLEDGADVLENLAAVGLMGISVFTAIALLCEKLRVSRNRTLMANLLGTAALAAYYLSLPSEVFDASSSHLIRYILLGAGLHFFIAVGPFFRQGQMNAFWQFNKSLFLRFLTAFLYSSVLYCGLAAAILAVDQLFDAHIRGDSMASSGSSSSGYSIPGFSSQAFPKILTDLRRTRPIQKDSRSSPNTSYFRWSSSISSFSMPMR